MKYTNHFDIVLFSYNYCINFKLLINIQLLYKNTEGFNYWMKN
jgi:hypothetical protein